MAKQDILQQAKENYADAQDAVREQNARFREDLRFSNPAQPEQWDSFAIKARVGRPMLTLDRTNQFISQIVNDARQNKPSIQVLPADSQADPDVAQQLNGIIRHIEYASRASIAYDTSIELSARVGQGWLRPLPKVVRPDTNEQEIIIQRVHDPMSICLDPNSVEPDGSDAYFGFAESTMTDKAFERAYPKAKKSAWDSEGWFSEEGVRVCEYFKIVEKKSNRIAVAGPDGGRMVLTEDDYWKMAAQIGYKPVVQDQFMVTTRTVKWCKLSGVEVLEETEFPADYVPLIPVLGYELWVEGKRYVCGMVRRLMDGQRLHNYEMSALTETLMAQPKAPFLLSSRAVDGHEDEWRALNSGNPAYTTYNDLDEQGPINSPIRLQPPQFPTAYANGAQLAISEMEASVGMYKSNLGQQSNAVSGRAKLADQREGDTANFHYIDNLRRSMEHMGRIIVSMIPRIYDTRRQAKILGEDGEQSSVEIVPGMGQAVQKKGSKIVAIDPTVGTYDVRVKVGPSYTSMREEAGQRIVEISQGNPQLGAALAPLLVKMNDMPEAEKISRVCLALLPPEVQKAYAEDDEADDLPPAIKMQMEQQGQQIQQMAGAMDQAAEVIKDLQQQLDAKNTAVQDQAKIAMSDIRAAQAGLQTQAEQLKAQKAGIDAAEDALKQQVTIARLEIQLEQQQEAEQPERTATESAQQPVQITVPSHDEAMNQLTQSVADAQAAMVAALEQNTLTVAKLQSLTVDAIEDMADAIAAPRSIQLQKGADGRTTGATSVAVMSEGGGDD